MLQFNEKAVKEALFKCSKDPKIMKYLDMAENGREFEWKGGTEVEFCRRTSYAPDLQNKFISIDITKFETGLSQKLGSHIEPLFVSLCLFDMEKKAQISEKFYFDFLSKENITQLGITDYKIDSITSQKRAIFECNTRKEDVILYINVYKVLQGDEDIAAEPYLHPEKVKDAKKLENANTEYLPRLGSYRQPLAFSVVSIFDKDGAIQFNGEVKTFFRTRGNMSNASFVSSQENQSLVRKLKMVPITLGLNIQEITQSMISKENGLVQCQDILYKSISDFSQNISFEIQEDFKNILYIYPESINISNLTSQSSSNSRNISVKVLLKDNDQNIDAEGLKAMIGRSSEQSYLTTHQYTAVTYHSRTLEFNDEIKLQIPKFLNKNHHLLFIFQHITCKQTKSSKDIIFLGYSYLHLMSEEGALISGKQSLDFFVDIPKGQGYTTQKAKEKKADKFSLSLKSVSPIVPSDPNLTSFFKSMKNALSNPTDPDIEKKFTNSLIYLNKVPPEEWVPRTNMVFDYLLKIISFIKAGQCRRRTFKILIQYTKFIGEESKSKRSPLLSYFIDHYFTNFSGKLLFEDLLSELIIEIAEDQMKRGLSQKEENDIPSYVNHSWFFFDMIYKSIVIHLSDSKKLNLSIHTDVLSSSFYQLLEQLTTGLCKEVGYQAGTTATNSAKNLNSYFALFLRDLLDVADRGYVMRVIQVYLDKLFEVAPHKQYTELKSRFFHILLDYEHLVPLSLPIYPKIPTVEQDFTSQTYLIGIFTNNFIKELMNEDRNNRIKFITILRYILSKHEYDQKLTNKGKVCTIYWPLFLKFLDIHDNYMELAEKQMNSSNKEIKTLEEELFNIKGQIKTIPEEERNSDTFNKLKEEESKANAKVQQLKIFVYDESLRVKQELQSLFACFMFILTNVDKTFLKSWFKAESKTKIATFLGFMKSTLKVFVYEGSQKILYDSKKKEGKATLTTMNSAIEQRGSERLNEIKKTGQRNFKSILQTRQKSTITRDSMEAITETTKSNDNIKKNILFEGYMNTEISLSVLLFMYDFFNDYNDIFTSFTKQSTQTNATISIIEKYFEVIQGLLDEKQSENTIITTCNFLSLLMNKHKNLLFSQFTRKSYSETLCSEILKLMYSPFSTIRTVSIILFYDLFKNNQLLSGNILKMKTQSSFSISNLTNNITVNDINLIRSGFKGVETYIKKENIHKEFVTGFIEHLERLSKSLADHDKISKLEQKNVTEEMISEIYYEVAKGYKYAVGLFISWIKNLALHHEKYDRQVESAQCYIYITAISYHYFKTKKSTFINYFDYDNLLKCAPYLKNEKFADIVKYIDQENAEQLEAFTEQGLIDNLEKIIELFTKSTYYESSLEIYEILTKLKMKQPIKEPDDWVKLKKYFNSTAGLAEHMSLSHKKSRYFGSFYRVIHYGLLTNEDNGIEYIYKMPKITRLVDACIYIQKYYIDLYGEDKVKILRDGESIEGLSKQKETIAILITSVDPYYKEKPSIPEHMCVKHFLVENPFALDGKNHSKALEDQYKRTTIFEIDIPFPYILTRQKVIKKDEIVSTPIENAIDLIVKTNQKLNDVVYSDPLNLNQLRMLVSGAVIPQVNEGIPSIIKAFFGDSKTVSKKEHVEKLKTSFVLFLDLAKKAIEANKLYAKDEKMIMLQEEFEKGHNNLSELFRVACEKK